MKERNKEILELEQVRREFLDIVARAHSGMWTNELLDRVLDLIAAVHRKGELSAERTWTRKEVIEILDAAHREGAATIKQRFLADLPITWRGDFHE